jgi:phospholipase C
MSSSRRDFLRTFAAATGAGVGSTLFPPAIRKALAISPRREKGTIEDRQACSDPDAGEPLLRPLLRHAERRARLWRSPTPDADASKRVLAGASTVDTLGEYHEFVPWDVPADRAAPLHRPYGLGPRVPMYVVSPWSKGGWVNSEVFDHTSVIRFLEKRFGVKEPNISAWRRSVANDLSSLCRPGRARFTSTRRMPSRRGSGLGGRARGEQA